MTLPHGFTVRLGDGLLTAPGDDVLIGGSPLTAIRLSARAKTYVSVGSVTVSDQSSAAIARRLLATNLAHPDLTDVPALQADQLTVVIPVRDRPDQLAHTLEALQPLRCIVVDDASRDPDAVSEVCARHGAECVALERNVGPAGARNVGLSHVRTPFVAFVDSDVAVTDDALLLLSRHFADPMVALAGPRVVGRPRASSPRWFERYDAMASSLTLGRQPSNVRPGAVVAWLPSACLVARVAALDTGFDAGMRVGEDVDLVLRLVAAGHSVRYDPSITAAHDTRPTLGAWLGRKFVYGTGGARLADRHGGAIAPAILTVSQAGAATALLMRHKWSPLLATGAVLWTATKLRSALPTPSGPLVALRISTRGLGWAVRQESALAVRHWWPATVAAACISRQARGALLTALAVDSAVALAQSRNEPDRPRIAIVLAGRRLDDLAYGAGLWWGSLRGRSARALMTRSPRRDPA